MLATTRTPRSLRPPTLAPRHAPPRVGAPHPPRRASAATAPSVASSADAVLASAQTFAEQVAADASAAPFVWEHNWYPVLCVSGLSAADAGRPHAVQVLGLDLVAWRDASATWRVARDACPHRLAPMSEGRLDPNPRNGGAVELTCSYHGWSFGGCGACTRIPQSEHDPTALATALASPRTRLHTFPTVVAAGLLFVWPDTAPGAAERAAAAPPPPVPTEVLDAVEKRGWYVRDTFYPYEILCENLIDPAHLPVSHHGLATLDRANAKPVPMRRRPPSPDDPGATIDFDIASVMAPRDVIDTTSRLTFYAPTHVRYRYRFGGKNIQSTCLYAVPTAPGRSRVFLCDAGYADPDAPPPGAPRVPPAKQSLGFKLKMVLMLIKFKLLPAWWGHLTGAGKIFDSDGVLLFLQDARLQAAQAASNKAKWATEYYLVSSDSFVASIRAWFDKVGGGGPRFAPGAQPAPLRPVPVRVALDRAIQHTALCPLCQKGRRQTTVARNAAVGVAVAALLAAAAAAGRAATLAARPVLASLAVAALAIAAADKLHRGVLPLFDYVGHVHADNN